MILRMAFVGIAAFWVTMNVLLWRAEFGGAKEAVSRLPVERVWLKVLTAPDSSALEVYQHGKRIGYCRWVANAGEELATGRIHTEDVAPEGMIRQLTHYTLNLDGNFHLAEFTNFFRFDFNFKFSTNQNWEEMRLRLMSRPNEWVLLASNPDQSVRLKVEGGAGWERRFSFAQLQNPEVLLREVGGGAGGTAFGFTVGLLSGPDTQTNRATLQNTLLGGLKWEARNDSIRFGHNQLRVYTLRAKLLGRYEAVLYISPVGEILRIELPDGIVMVNDAFPSLKTSHP